MTIIKPPNMGMLSNPTYLAYCRWQMNEIRRRPLEEAAIRGDKLAQRRLKELDKLENTCKVVEFIASVILSKFK